VRLLYDIMSFILGNPDKFVGRPVCCRAYRFIADTRDQDTSARWIIWKTRIVCSVATPSWNCVDVCPKELNPTEAIGKIKDMMVKRSV